MASLHIGKVPEHIKKRFQAVCKEPGQTMSQAVLDFMKQTVGQDIVRIASAKLARRGRFRK
jgi:antitoxin component of RelBE/YafQ-DinJ toxin-antitoxin module